jgi:hypothetical protein
MPNPAPSASIPTLQYWLKADSSAYHPIGGIGRGDLCRRFDHSHYLSIVPQYVIFSMQSGHCGPSVHLQAAREGFSTLTTTEQRRT